MVYLGSLQNDVLKMSCGTMTRWAGKKPRMCLRDGDYLVRVSGQRGYVLTTKWMSMPKHFIIQTDDEVSYSTVCWIFPVLLSRLTQMQTFVDMFV